MRQQRRRRREQTCGGSRGGDGGCQHLAVHGRVVEGVARPAGLPSVAVDGHLQFCGSAQFQLLTLVGVEILHVPAEEEDKAVSVNSGIKRKR